MKKLIIKTIAISLAIVIAVFTALYLIIASASPSTLSNIYFRLNSKNLTLKYSELSYEKSSDISDLSILVERSIKFEDNALVEEYGFKLINDEEYSNFLQTKDSGYNYYIVGSLSKSLYLNGKADSAISVAFENTLVYSNLNPIRVVISLAVEKLDFTALETIKQKEQSDKSLLRLEWVVGILSIIVLFVPILIGALLPELEEWKRVVICFSGFIPAFVGFFYAVRIEQIAGYYECKHCGHKYVPTFKAVSFSRHMGRTRYMECPNCHKKSWQKKVVSKD
jgi:hypothetical protein